MFLNVDNVGVERMSSGRLFQATGPAKENARLLSCSLVLDIRPNHHEQRNGGKKGWNSGNRSAHLVRIQSADLRSGSGVGLAIGAPAIW